MSVSTADARVRALVVALVVGVLTLVGAASAQADDATSVVLTVEVTSGVDVNTYTGVRMHAVVRPASATGRVTFYVDGAKLGAAPVVDGAADLGSTIHVADGVPATAVFEPASASGRSAVTSPEIAIAVQAVPRVWLVDDGGAAMPDRARITSGKRYRLVVSGFRFGSSVRVTLGSRTLDTPRVGASGTGSVLVTVPALRPGTYRLAARSGSRSATTSVVLLAGAGSTGPSPNPTAPAGGNVSVVVPSAGQSLPTTGGDDGTDDDDGADGGATLPRTGSDVAASLALSAVALLVGVALVVATRRRPPGRHEGVR